MYVDVMDGTMEESNRGEWLAPEEARKRLKAFIWPELSRFDSTDTFRRMFVMQVNAAQSEGIPDGLIKNAIQQHLLKGNTAQVFAQLCGKMEHDTLYDILELLNFVDPLEQCLSEEERFKKIRLNADETAISFMNRIEVAFEDLFGSNATGMKRRIKKQFLDGFRKKGVYLDEQEKDFLMMHSDLVELAIATDKKFELKLDKFKERQLQGQPPKGPPRQDYRRGPSKETTGQQTQSRQTHMASGAVPKSINVVTQGRNNQGGAANRPKRRPKLVSAGPHAKRIKLTKHENKDGCSSSRKRKVTPDEVIKGTSKEGFIVCYKCCEPLHIGKQCRNSRFCSICNSCMNHTTKQHYKRKFKGISTSPAPS